MVQSNKIKVYGAWRIVMATRRPHKINQWSGVEGGSSLGVWGRLMATSLFMTEKHYEIQFYISPNYR